MPGDLANQALGLAGHVGANGLPCVVVIGRFS